jgi:putative NADH-flavin reductase
MKIVVFGASGPTGLELCRQALAAGHQVVAAVRRPSDFQLRNDALTIVQADVTDGSPLNPAINRSDAVLSVLGAAYSRRQINVYSVGTKAIVAAMRASDHCRRLVVVSSGMTMHPLPKVRGFFMDEVMVPFLRNVIGRTLYADMARMEDYLATCDDIEWTIMRPGRLLNGDGVTKYQLADDFPVGNVTSRPDLAAAMLAELGPNPHVHQKMSPTTR